MSACTVSDIASLATLLIFFYLGVDSAAVSGVITRVLGVALLFTAAALILRPWLLRTYAGHLSGISNETTRAYTILTGVALGVLVTISSVGAGALGVTALILLYPKLPIVRIAGSDIAHAVPLTLLAGIGHLAGGSINPWTLVSLLTGSLPGIGCGDGDALKVKRVQVRKLIGDAKPKAEPPPF